MTYSWCTGKLGQSRFERKVFVVFVRIAQDSFQHSVSWFVLSVGFWRSRRYNGEVIEKSAARRVKRGRSWLSGNGVRAGTRQ